MNSLHFFWPHFKYFCFRFEHGEDFWDVDLLLTVWKINSSFNAVCKTWQLCQDFLSFDLFGRATALSSPYPPSASHINEGFELHFRLPFSIYWIPTGACPHPGFDLEENETSDVFPGKLWERILVLLWQRFLIKIIVSKRQTAELFDSAIRFENRKTWVLRQSGNDHHHDWLSPGVSGSETGSRRVITGAFQRDRSSSGVS